MAFLVGGILLMHASPLLALAGGLALGVFGRRGVAGFIDRVTSPEKREQAREERNARRNRQKEEIRQRERQQAKDALERPYTKDKGWNMLAFPADMKGNVYSANDKQMYFDVAGKRDMVRGEVQRDGSVKYSFRVDDLNDARTAKEKMAMFNGTVKMQDQGNAWLFVADKPETINEFAKSVYPQRKASVERLDTEIQQFTIPNCKSPEEAMEKLRANPDLFTPSNTYHKITDTIDGVTTERNIGESRNDSLYLPLGSYVVELSKTEAYKGDVTIPSALKLDADGERAYAASNFVSDNNSLFQEKCSVEPELKDATKANIPRYSLDDNMNVLDVHNNETAAKSLSKQGFEAYVLCDTLKEATDLVADGKISKNALVLVDREKPSDIDKYVVSVPLDSEVFSRLALQGEASPSHAANFQNYGLSERDLEASTMYSSLTRDGFATFRTKDDISVSKGKVNGLSVDEFADRVVDGRMMNLNENQMNQWLRDAALVQSVTVTIDKKNAELQITSVVNNTQLIEKRKLSDKEVADFARRGEISKAEMKDLLIQMHPDYFKTYSFNGKGLVKDPVGDFLKGQKPTLDQNLVQQQKQQQAKQKQAKPTVKPTQAPKPKPKPKMKIG